MRIFSVLALLFSLSAHAEPLKKFDLSPAQIKSIQEHHQSLNMTLPMASTRPAPARPFSEVEQAGYLFFSSDTNFDSELAKQTMARHLPAGVTLVIYTRPGDDKTAILNEYRGVIDASRVKVFEISNAGRGFWARDGLPVPVWSR